MYLWWFACGVTFRFHSKQLRYLKEQVEFTERVHSRSRCTARVPSSRIICDAPHCTIKRPRMCHLSACAGRTQQTKNINWHRQVWARTAPGQRWTPGSVCVPDCSCQAVAYRLCVLLSQPSVILCDQMKPGCFPTLIVHFAPQKNSSDFYF